MNLEFQSILQQVIQAFRAENFDSAYLLLNGALKADINNAETILELGITYTKVSRFKEALAVFHCLQPHKNTDLRIPYNLGLIYSLQGMHQLALESYNLALKIQPKDVETLINKGALYNDSKNYDLALEVLENAIRIRPDIPEAWSNKGIALNNLNLYQESVSAYNEAIKLNPNYYEAWSNKSVPLNQLKLFSEANDACDKAISLNSDYPEAHLNKGITLRELKHYEEAITHFDQALNLRPDYLEAHFNKGNTLRELKRYEEAINHYDKAISLKANYYEAWTNRGVTQHELKRFDEAMISYDKALDINTHYAEVWSNKGVTLHELKRFDEAIAQFEKALSLEPDYQEAWTNKGVALHELKRFNEAIISYDKALDLNSNNAEAWTNKGVALHELKRFNEAIISYDKALDLNSNNAEAWTNKGVALHELKRFNEAITHYNKAISFKSDYYQTWVNKGITLHELKRFNEAIISYDKVLALNSNYAEAWSDKGETLSELKRYDEAIAHYHKALSLQTNLNWIDGNLLHTKMRVCSWSSFGEYLGNITKKVSINKKVVTPFILLSLTDDAILHKQCSEIYVRNRFPFNNALGPTLKPTKKEKIRIGYFSADFKNHPVSILTAELFELHDKNKFEIIAFSFGADDKSLMRFRLSRAFDQFIDVSAMSDLEIAKLSRDLSIDIAVDLGGYTAESRTGIFAYRAAPIQASYIGYLSTMGSEYIDYLIADKTIIPDGLEHFYSEKIVYLPSYQVNDRKRAISERRFTRQELGLPKKGFVFCCFNNNYKILPETFSAWMRILKATEGSVLLLYAENEWVETNLTKEAEALGIDSTRLVFGKSLPPDEYLARYRMCDLFLDTFPYNAGTTASDALWTGLPVLTLLGKSFASRMAASLLNAIKLPELISNTQEEYEALAIELAMNPQKLEEIRLKLANNRLTAHLFDTPLFTKNLESAYVKMYERYLADLQLDHITIA